MSKRRIWFLYCYSPFLQIVFRLLLLSAATVVSLRIGGSAIAQSTTENTSASSFNGGNIRCSNNNFLIRSFNVSSSDRVGALSLGLNVSYAYRGALAGFLQSPSGSVVQFLNIDGSDTNDNYDVLFQDGGTAVNDGTNDDVTIPFYDRIVNSGTPFSLFNGETANGVWNLYLCDGGTSLNGSYNRSQLTIVPISISGFAFDDTNSSQTKDANEGVLSDVGVSAYLDDGDGIYEPGTDDSFVATSQTNFSGEYTFSGLNAGDYWIEVDESDPDLAGRSYGGSSMSGTANPRLVSYSLGATTTADFPFFQNLAVLCKPGDPLGNLSFLEGATLEAGVDLQTGARYRFPDVFEGVDALVEVAAFNGGATLASLDNNSTGVTAAFQPVLLATSSATSSVDFDITFVEKGTTTPVAFDFKAFGVDIDGDGNALREFIELTNLDSYELSGDTTLVASAIASGNRFESNTTAAQPGVSATVDSTRVTAQYVLVSQFRYRIGAIAGAGSATQRLNSLYFGCTSGPTSSSPNVALTKRLTAINRDMADEQLFDSSFVDVGAPDDEDNAVNWPGPAVSTTVGSSTVESYITGIANGAISSIETKPGDELEYTISFLSNGEAAAQDVLICDKIPSNTTFVFDAYNDIAPAFAGGGDRGVLLSFDSAQTALTNASDGDEILDVGASDTGIGGYYFPAGSEPSTVFANINCGGANTNGVIVVDLSDIPATTGEGTPTDAYGFVRFKVRVD